jgi:ribonuclease G
VSWLAARARYHEEKDYLPWFRWLTKHISTDEPANAAAATAVPPNTLTTILPDTTSEQELDPETPDTADAAEADEVDEDGAPKKRRRRGSRGGRGRKKDPAAADGAAVADTTPAKPPARARTTKPPAKDSETAERKDGQRRRSGGTQRRKQPPRRAPLPAARRELMISVDVGEQRVAVLEDDRVAEVYLERPESRSIVGNIYLGTVDNVLPGMEAAFIEIGLEKNGFLYVDEIVVPELEGKRHGKKIQDLISRGEKILVQAVKDPMKTKGARLTTEISLPGRFLVFVPNGEGLGVSRRLEDAERTRLKEILKAIAPKDGGVIVRTAAEGASAEDVERDLVFLQRLWKTIQSRSEQASAPELVYQEAELPLRIVRDLFAGDFVAAHVDNDRTHKRIVGYLKKTSPHMVERVQRWKERERLFEHFGIERELASTLERRVDLPSGGYLIFDYAEAFTVIDVNTGRFVGSRSKTSTQRLEDTIVKNNLEAVKEVVRQLRLRDIGGIIVIDFIDMANPKNRQAVEEAFRLELERDRTKTYVVEISPLGLVEMTRQNVTDGPREVMTRKCTTCGGDGIVVSDATYAMEAERKLRALAASGAGSRVQGYRVAVNPRTLALLAGPGGGRLIELEDATRRRFFLTPATGHTHGDHLEVLAEGRLEDLQPASPLEEGAELEVKLVEVGLHDAAAGVAKIDGHDVVVAGAAKLVGKKAKVVIGRVLEGQAFASLAGGVEVPIPITFESEAEKPTRAPARRKPAAEALVEPETDAEDAVVDAETAETEVGEAVGDADEADDADEAAAAVEGEEGAAPKKRTRRGSRGGRRRKKKPAGVEASADGADTEPDEHEPGAADDAEPAAPTAAKRPARPRAPRSPKIHVPADGREPAAAGVASPATPADATVDAEDEVVVEPNGGAEETAGNGAAPPRKRTRRGSRGGRRRRKPAGAGAASADEAGGVDAENGLEAPEPPATGDAGDDATPDEAAPAPRPRAPRARTPRPKPAAPEPAEASAPASGDYVPMSEWIDEFER